uniref:R3H domain-containing protein n=1 Tax=Rhipicephalus appendiculatus TaxID=34631 RepID=A0A131YWT2_RHIAP
MKTTAETEELHLQWGCVSDIHLGIHVPILCHSWNQAAVANGTLCLLESELCLSFEREPCGEKHYRLASSFERLLLHALCQYMSLFAHSYDVEGKRWTRVRNSTAEFCRPSESLSAYLERYWAARGAC